MRHFSTAATALLFALMGSASAGATQSETVGQFLVSQPERLLDPVIGYCSENVPQLKNDLLKERAAFIDKLTEAGKPLVDRFKNDPEFNSPVQESMRQDIDKINSDAMNIFRQQDPGITCGNVLANIQNATVDNLRQVVEDNYQKYRGTVPAKNPE